MNLCLQHTREPILLSCQFILDFYRIHYTSPSLENYFENHPEYFSLLSLKEVIGEYGVKSVSIRKCNFKHDDFEIPVVYAIHRSNWPSPAFSLITDVSVGRITFSDPISGRSLKESLSDFISNWKKAIWRFSVCHCFFSPSFSYLLSFWRGFLLCPSLAFLLTYFLGFKNTEEVLSRAELKNITGGLASAGDGCVNLCSSSCPCKYADDWCVNGKFQKR